MPEFSLEQVRHRAEATYGAVANTGRFRYAPLGVFCIIMAIALIAAAVFIPSANYELAGSGALVLAIGVMLIFLFDPNPAVRHVEAFDTFCQETDGQWTSTAQETTLTALQPILTDLRSFASNAVASGAGVKAATEALRAAELQGKQLQGDLDQRLTEAIQASKSTQEQLYGQSDRLRTTIRRGSLWFRAGPIRRLANRVVNARESHLAGRRLVLGLQALRDAFIEPFISEIQATLESWEDSASNPLANARDVASGQIADFARQGDRSAFGKSIPATNELIALSRGIVEGRLPEIRRAVMHRPEKTPIQDAINEQVRAAIQNSRSIPEHLTDWLDTRNGWTEDLLSHLSEEGAELAVSKLIPGREQRRFRTVLVQGGASSPFTKAIKDRAEGCEVRGMEHDNEGELIVLTESRFEPGAELVELMEASESLAFMSDEMKAATVTAVDDDDLVLKQCRPENRRDSERGLRLLCVGLGIECLARKGESVLPKWRLWS